jgi:lysine 2,3-aminomutase
MSENTWKKLLKDAATSREGLKNFSLTEKEIAFFDYTGAEDKLSFMVNSYYSSLAGDSEYDPVRRQFIPTVDEYHVKDYELTDPLGENRYSPVPRLIHRYRDRVLLLVTDACAMYCRHCFRRSFTGHDGGVVRAGELKGVARYLEEHQEVNEILLSGGDPLTCSDIKIAQILEAVRSVRPDMVIRLATRMPVVLPQRFTDNLISLLAGAGPLWLVTQFNHKNELTPESTSAIKRIVDKGIPVLNQSVLLKGVNDKADTLADLFQALVRLKVKPYYLFQGDLAAGTSHFRVSITRGREIMRELRRKISGLAMPVYAVDMPGGGGKIPLTENYTLGEDEDKYYFKNIEGKEYTYPREN